MVRSVGLTGLWLVLVGCGGGESKGDSATDGAGSQTVTTPTQNTTMPPTTVPTTTTTTTTMPASTVADLQAAGPYVAGTDKIFIDGSDGVDKVQIWYPSEEPSANTTRYDGIIASNAYLAVPEACDEQRPVVMFSHGYAGTRYQSAFFAEHLATHGYIVVAPDHTKNTLFDLDDNAFWDLILRRPIDISDSYDWLISSDFAHCVDPEAGYAAVGHSFGGYTALALAGAQVNDPFAQQPTYLDDDRVWAAVGWAPWDAEGAITTGTEDVGVPTLILTGDLDVTTELAQVTDLWTPIDQPGSYFGRFETGGHYTFSPTACLVGFAFGDGCGDDYIDIDVATNITQHATLAFLHAQVFPVAADQIPTDASGMIWEQQ